MYCMKAFKYLSRCLSKQNSVCVCERVAMCVRAGVIETALWGFT